MKASKYNLYFQLENEYYVYNQLTSTLLDIDIFLFNRLKNNEITLENFDIEEMQSLVDANIILDNEKEANYVLFRNRMARFNSRILRLTIMPTLECNFSCWYCYENHVPSMMSEETMDSIYTSIIKILKQNHIKTVIIDWFGGEPLIYLDEIVYPLSKKILVLCKESNITFINQITTNGYLIDDKAIEKFIDIELRSFQITIDGDEKSHNLSRFTESDHFTFNKIVSNIENICNKIDKINMTLRINYTPETSFESISKSFTHSVRNRIHIQPQFIWQFKNEINIMDSKIHDKLKVFANDGFVINDAYIPIFRGVSCYVDNMMQFVISWNGELFKCTARDFSTSKTSIGKLDSKGNMIFNSYFYHYFQSSSFENEKCINCNLLPSCMGGCLQKRIENNKFSCHKGSLKQSIINQLKLIVETTES